MVTEAGTEAAALFELLNVTIAPPAFAGALNVIVPAGFCHTPTTFAGATLTVVRVTAGTVTVSDAIAFPR